MADKRKAVGNAAENAAAQYLKHLGYNILFRNWHCKSGELDIVAQKNDTIHIVEVRCRRDGAAVDAMESVNYSKIMKVKNAANEFLYVHEYTDSYVSIDIVTCVLKEGIVTVTGFYENVTG